MSGDKSSAQPSMPCVWKVDDMNQLHRFLCWGLESSNYTCEDKALPRDGLQCINNLIENAKGVEAVAEIQKFCLEGRTARQEPVIYALAVCAKQSIDLKTKQAAFATLAEVCKIPTSLFLFVKFTEELCSKRAENKTTGWGRAQRRAISDWYTKKDPKHLAVSVTKYRQRKGWSHRDLIRLSHINAKKDSGTSLVLTYVAKGLEQAKKDFPKDDSTDEIKDLLDYLDTVEIVKHSHDAGQVAALVEKHRLVREHVPTWLLNSKEVWRALLQDMPLEALIRSLGKISTLGLLDPSDSDGCSEIVLDKLNNAEARKRARLHPFTILLALETYKKGQGEKGKKLKWTPDQAVVKALDSAFYAAFTNIEATKKRHLLAIDISGSMQYGSVHGSTQISPAVAAATMAMVTTRTEADYLLCSFSSSGITPLDLNGTMMLQQVCDALATVTVGGTDPSVPMQWALENKKAVDVFIIYTDCNSWPMQSTAANMLRKYRKEMNMPEARLVVCALTSSNFTIADPEDAGMLDIAGFDSAVPQIIHNFILGNL